jgi:hypothetical protein
MTKTKQAIPKDGLYRLCSDASGREKALSVLA